MALAYHAGTGHHPMDKIRRDTRQSERQMKAIRILVSSSNDEVSEFLNQTLSRMRFEVSAVVPGKRYREVVQRVRPAIALVDVIDERPDAARSEVEILREVCPEARIVALSRSSSSQDAGVIEQGVFYYLANDWQGRLSEVIEAAALAFLQSETVRQEDPKGQGVIEIDVQGREPFQG